MNDYDFYGALKIANNSINAVRPLKILIMEIIMNQINLLKRIYRCRQKLNTRSLRIRLAFRTSGYNFSRKPFRTVCKNLWILVQ